MSIQDGDGVMRSPFRRTELFDADAMLFVLICESQSFSKAASAIGQTQSSVSRRIDAFERKLGLTLFDRTVRPIAPTQEGRVLFHELKHHADALEETVGRIRIKNALNPVIHIGCVESLSLDLVPKLIEKLLPVTSRVLQVTATSNTLVNHLLEHKLDIIISSDLFPGIRGLNRRVLFREPSLLILPKAMAKAKTGPWTWSDLQFCGRPYIYYHKESGGGRLNETYLSSQYLSLPNKIEVDSNTVMVSLIADNLGWTIARPSMLLQTRMIAQGVAAVPMPEPLLYRDLVMISHKSEDKVIVEACYRAACSVLRDEVLPELVDVAPWLKDGIRLYENRNESKVSINSV